MSCVKATDFYCTIEEEPMEGVYIIVHIVFILGLVLFLYIIYIVV